MFTFQSLVPFTQVGRVCVENCQQFDGFSLTYRLEVPDRNVSADLQSCYTAISITQAPDKMWGLLYVNDSEALRRPRCQDLQYIVVAQEKNTQQEASTQIHILLDGEGETITARVHLKFHKVLKIESSYHDLICANLKSTLVNSAQHAHV